MKLDLLNKKIDIPFITFEIGILWFCFTSFHLSFSLSKVIPLFASSFVCLLLTLPLLISRPNLFIVSRSKFILIILLLIIYVYQIAFALPLNLIFIVSFTIKFFLGVIIIVAAPKIQIKLIDAFTRTLGIILAISLFGWLLYLIGVPLPHYTTYDGKFYVHTQFYLFQLNGYPGEQLIPRFTSMFLEPGHLAGTCLFLLFINRFNLKRWENVLMIIGILLSFSLAGYGLLLASYGFYLITYSQHKILYATIFSILIIITTVLLINVLSSENPVYKMILSRLEYDESSGDISGNNRYSTSFETHYSIFIKSNDKYLGVGKTPEEERWWINSAGWKRLIVTQGIIGTLLIFVFYLSLYIKNRSIPGLELLFLFILSNMIRDHVIREYWLYIYILSLPILKETYNNYKKYPIINE